MIHYKLTCIKDMPECNKGFSYSFSEDDLDLSQPILFSSNEEENTKINCLKFYQNNTEYVSKELDEQKSLEVNCPSCGRKTLYPHIEKGRTYDDGVTKYWSSIYMVCANCGKKLPVITKMPTRITVKW